MSYVVHNFDKIGLDVCVSMRRNHIFLLVAAILIAILFFAFIALKLFASGSFLQVVEDCFGVVKSKVYFTNRDVFVSPTLNTRSNQFIEWPSLNKIKNRFFKSLNPKLVNRTINLTQG